MEHNKKVIAAPRYMETFQCVGSACEEHCCQGWQVSIDQATFDKYQASRHPGLAERFRTVLLRRDAPTARAYGSIRLEADDNCPFLDTARLCQIQTDLGADHLSETCQTYPRQYIAREEGLALFASISCPEVARKALLRADAMDVVELPLPADSAAGLALGWTDRQGAAGGAVLHQMFEYVAGTAGQIVRTPAGNASDALIILAIMVRQIEPYCAAVTADARSDMAQVLMRYFEPVYLTQALELARAIHIRRDLQLSLLWQTVNAYFQDNLGRASYWQVVADAMRGMGYASDDLAGSEARYVEAEQRWFTPFDDAHPHLLKNYLLNEMGRKAFPVGKDSGIEHEFIGLALRYSLIRMLLIGTAGHRQAEFGEADYVRVIYTFSRNIDHNRHFMQGILAQLDEAQMNNVATAIMLVR
jgi:lysine-N-methylase